eukprot:scaffold87761_cov32-Tisochrysis_lutea.AAC.1
MPGPRLPCVLAALVPGKSQYGMGSDSVCRPHSGSGRMQRQGPPPLGRPRCGLPDTVALIFPSCPSLFRNAHRIDKGGEALSVGTRMMWRGVTAWSGHSTDTRRSAHRMSPAANKSCRGKAPPCCRTDRLE